MIKIGQSTTEKNPHQLNRIKKQKTVKNTTQQPACDAARGDQYTLLEMTTTFILLPYSHLTWVEMNEHL